MDTEKIIFEYTAASMRNAVDATMNGLIVKALEPQQGEIIRGVQDYFKANPFESKNSAFDRAINWAIDDALRTGLESALKKVNLTELVEAEALALLQDKEFIRALAVERVRAAMGLPPMEDQTKNKLENE